MPEVYRLLAAWAVTVAPVALRVQVATAEVASRSVTSPMARAAPLAESVVKVELEVPSEERQELPETQATAVPVVMVATAAWRPAVAMGAAQVQVVPAVRAMPEAPLVRSREVLPDVDRMVVQAARPERLLMLVRRLSEALVPMAELVPMAVRVALAAQAAPRTARALSVARAATVVRAARVVLAEAVVHLVLLVEPVARAARAEAAAPVAYSAPREPRQAAPSVLQETRAHRVQAAMAVLVALASTTFRALAVMAVLVASLAHMAMVEVVVQVAPAQRPAEMAALVVP